jgi:hypothetical protein
LLQGQLQHAAFDDYAGLWVPHSQHGGVAAITTARLRSALNSSQSMLLMPLTWGHRLACFDQVRLQIGGCAEPPRHAVLDDEGVDIITVGHVFARAAQTQRVAFGDHPA